MDIHIWMQENVKSENGKKAIICTAFWKHGSIDKNKYSTEDMLLG